MCLVTVRLAGDNRPSNAGRLEVNYNNTWGTVCYWGTDDTDVQVACYMLGFGWCCICLTRSVKNGYFWLKTEYKQNAIIALVIRNFSVRKTCHFITQRWSLWHVVNFICKYWSLGWQVLTWLVHVSSSIKQLCNVCMISKHSSATTVIVWSLQP